MRQAGRYLPEYQALRAKADSFLALCFDPAMATDVTLQPVRRFDLDAAILFSDILVVPFALGRRVDFVEGSGPRLDPIDASGIGRLDGTLVVDRLGPVLETVAKVRTELAADKTMIGFVGAPWTVATYMIAGRGTSDQAPALEFASRHPDATQALIDTLVEATVDFLVAQIRAGADVVQIFDTWAGVLTGDDFERWCVQPTAEIVQAVKANEPGARIIGFPKGIGDRLEHYATHTGVDGLSLDATVPLSQAARLQSHVAVQGNLDPEILVEGGERLDRAVADVLAALGGGRFIFNLGHGVLPQTPVANVERLVKRVRGDG
jgi:uroporphyrinogen decarboxylase